MSENQTVEFVDLKGFDDYQILSEYPFTIRRKDNHYVVNESLHQATGYIRTTLNRKKYLKHRLIALQFIPNDDPINNDVVDHINHDRTDNHLSNLRWVSTSDNNYNKAFNNGYNYEYVDELPNDAIVVDEYNNHHFEDLYYYNDVFYFYNGIKYRKLRICETNRGSLIVYVKDTNNRKCVIYYSSFKQQYGL